MIDTISAENVIADRYRLLEEVGQGGMATVFRGQDLVLDREIAVKILHPHLARESEHRQRFRREARTIARLHHPSIVEIYDFSDQDSLTDQGPSQGNQPIYLVMEFVDGFNLQTFLDQQEFPLPELAAAMVATIAEALEHAHQENIIHRDLKPENVLICSNGTVKLTDFGLARILDNEAMTRTGSILGSPAYMAPEQIQGKLGDHRADIFALGIILYRLACKKHPFLRNNPAATLQAVSNADYTDPERVSPGIGRHLANIIRRALSPSPADRYPTAAAMRSDLMTYLYELGLHQPEQTLRRFFLNPQEEAETLRQQLLTQLKQRAYTLAANKKYSMALDRCNRALALEPNDPDIDKLLERLSQKEQWYQQPVYWLASGLTCSLLLAGWWYLPSLWQSLWSKKEHAKTADSGNNPTQSVALATRSSLWGHRARPHSPQHKQSAAVRPTPALRDVPERPPHRPRHRFVLPHRNPVIPHPITIKAGWHTLQLNKRTVRFRYQPQRRLLQIRGLRGLHLQHVDLSKVVSQDRYTLRLKGKAPYQLMLSGATEKRLILLTPARRRLLRRRKVAPPPPPAPRKPDYILEANPKVEPFQRKLRIVVPPYASIIARSGDLLIKKGGSRDHIIHLLSNRVWTIRASHPYAYTRVWQIQIPSDQDPKVLDMQEKDKGWQPLIANQSDGGFELRERLKVKPASIYIRSNATDAMLFIDNQPKNQLTHRYQPITIPWTWRTEKTKIEVIVTHDSYLDWTKTLEIKPGQTIRLDVKMIPRKQNKPGRGNP